MLKLINTFQIAIKALTRSKVRTFLTVLGVLVGISSVTIIISAGDSVEELIFKQVESFGSNYIQTEVRVPQGSGGTMSQAQGVVISTLKEKDRQDFLELENIDKAYGSVMTQDVISWQGELNKVMIYGVGPDYIDIDTTEIDQGRFYTEEEDDGLARVIVLGSKVKEDLFGASEAIGQNVKINKNSFRVIGVAKPRGTIFTFDLDDIAYVPVQTAQNVLMGIDYLSTITSQMKDPSKEDETADQMRQILRENHDIDDPTKDDFEVMSATEAKELMSTILGGVTILLVVLALVQIVTGAIRSSDFAQKSSQATSYCQGAMEKIRSYRDQNWDLFIIACDAKNSAVFQLNTPPLPSDFTLIFDECFFVSDNQRRVTLKVQWSDSTGNHESKLTSYFSNWQ